MSESKFRANNLAAFGASTLRDTPKYLKDAPEVSRGLWQWYTKKYLGRSNPFFHFMIFVGVVGYTFNYHHLSKGYFLLFVFRDVNVSFFLDSIEHEKEEREKCIREGRPVKII